MLKFVRSISQLLSDSSGSNTANLFLRSGLSAGCCWALAFGPFVIISKPSSSASVSFCFYLSGMIFSKLKAGMPPYPCIEPQDPGFASLHACCPPPDHIALIVGIPAYPPSLPSP